MNVIGWLQRLGIFRAGGESAVYHNAKERPLSLQQDDVLDSKKDVVDLNREKPAQQQAQK